MREQCAPLDDVVVIKLGRRGVLIELEGAIDVAKVIVLILQEAADHLGQVLLVLLRTSLVTRTCIRLLLNDASAIVEGPRRDEALLPRSALDVENQAVGRELLS